MQVQQIENRLNEYVAKRRIKNNKIDKVDN